MADERRYVGGLGDGAESIQILAETVSVPGSVLLGADQRLPEILVDAVVDRGGGEAAVAGDLGDHTLPDHALGPPVAEQREIGVVVGVDEAGRDDAAGRVQSPGGKHALEAADGSDLFPRQAHIGLSSRNARPIYH